MIQVRISNDALEDLEDGFRFYELQEPGLGDYFLSQLQQILMVSRSRLEFIINLTGIYTDY